MWESKQVHEGLSLQPHSHSHTPYSSSRWRYIRAEIIVPPSALYTEEHTEKETAEKAHTALSASHTVPPQVYHQISKQSCICLRVSLVWEEILHTLTHTAYLSVLLQNKAVGAHTPHNTHIDHTHCPEHSTQQRFTHIREQTVLCILFSLW